MRAKEEERRMHMESLTRIWEEEWQQMAAAAQADRDVEEEVQTDGEAYLSLGEHFDQEEIVYQDGSERHDYSKYYGNYRAW